MSAQTFNSRSRAGATGLVATLYDANNSHLLLNDRKIDEITALFIRAYGSPTWGIGAGVMGRGFREAELRFALRSEGGAVITVENSNEEIIGCRVATSFSGVISDSAQDARLAHAVHRLEEGVAGIYSLGDASYTLQTAVDAEYRGRSIGLLMIEMHVGFADSRNVPALIGWTLDTNIPMIRTYERAGYTPIEGSVGLKGGSLWDGKSFVLAEYEAGVTYRHLLIDAARP